MTRPAMNHSLELSALTDASRFPTRAVQYAGVGADGKLHIYGDQAWVRDGGWSEQFPGGVVLRRDITIHYGPWQELAAAQARDITNELINALSRAVLELPADSAIRETAEHALKMATRS